jgi:SAM-dependent methyltransferase
MKTSIISKINKFKDYLRFDKFRDDRLEIYKLIKNDSIMLDYGSGYFYQSIPNLYISGLRDTVFRTEIMKLNEIKFNKTILDIGCNTGSMILFKLFNHNADGLDYNTACINVAKFIKKKFNFQKCNFINDDFNNYIFKKKYDVVLSLANHHTYDGGITNSEKYFEKIKSILNSNGEIYLESHHPQIETKIKFYSLYENYLKNDFKIIRETSYKCNNFLDNGRYFIHLKSYK